MAASSSSAPAHGQRIHFPGLNTVRFLAAIAVMVYHIEQIKSLAGLGNIWRNPWILGLGPGAVEIFFVLSGFLITYLLLAEQEQTGTVNIEGFYIRRILRIWPLYYLITLWAFFLFPRILSAQFGSADALWNHFYRKLFLFLFMLPNVAFFTEAPVNGGAQAWSIGVEEQFYLVWPHVIRRFRRWLLPFFVILIIVKLAAVKGLQLLLQHWYTLGISPEMQSSLNIGASIFANFQIENLTVGGIAAYLYFHGMVQRLRFIRHPLAIAANSMLMTLLVAYRDFFLHGIIEAVVFAVLIIQIVCAPERWSNWEGRILRYFGNTSYGIYMYHGSVIAILVSSVLRVPRLTSSWLVINAVVYGSSITFTLLISAVSYSYFEAPFLRLKRRFAVIRSGGA